MSILPANAESQVFWEFLVINHVIELVHDLLIPRPMPVQICYDGRQYSNQVCPNYTAEDHEGDTDKVFIIRHRMDIAVPNLQN